MTNTFRTQYEEARKRGGIIHRKEKDLWEKDQQKKLKEKETNERKEEQGHSVKGTKEVKEKPVNEEVESSSLLRVPMEVDEPSESTEAEKEVHVPRLVEDEEDDLNTVVQFFLNGGDDGNESEEQVWAKLGQQVR